MVLIHISTSVIVSNFIFVDKLFQLHWNSKILIQLKQVKALDALFLPAVSSLKQNNKLKELRLKDMICTLCQRINFSNMAVCPLSVTLRLIV